MKSAVSSKEQIRYYKSFQDDFVESSDQDFALPEDYVWIRSGKGARIVRSILYTIACLFARVYGKIVLHLKIVRAVDMKDYRDTGAVVYGNHTQPIGDVFVPGWVCAPKRCYTIASPANLGIPVIGSLLPWMGALPIPADFKQMKAFLSAVRQRLQENNCIIVYPEQHVWPYCTQIRPYPATAFDYAVKNKVPAFCMTTTYQHRRFSKKPKTTVYLDGPFFAEAGLSPQAQKEALRDQVYACMQRRSEQSTCQYIEYRPAQEASADDSK
ncbi:MAG: 1-acyl-sn-glycerol-3-phosphate acyltransferase [Clostridiales bacterium]|nr:1-acyl-sn-glycerol-3-phosphate acyltransferase [Clostridiales bacterium]